MAQESGKPKTAVAKELGISVSLLYTWINQQNTARAKGQSLEALQGEQREYEIFGLS